MLSIIVFIPIIYFSVCLGHEMSHGLPLLKYDWKFVLKPYPHFHDGRLLFGACIFTQIGTQPPKSIKLLVALAPRISALLFLLLGGLGALLTTNPMLDLFFKGLAVGAAIDTFVFMIPLFHSQPKVGTDPWEAWGYTQMSEMAFRALWICLCLVFYGLTFCVVYFG